MDGPQKLLTNKHVEFVTNLSRADNTLGYHLTEHLRLNGIYWGITTLALLGNSDALDRKSVVEYVRSCWNSVNGGFSSHPNHDTHILSTLSGIQILVTLDATKESDIDTNKVVDYILSLRRPNKGYFTGDEWGESDTRFTYCAINTLSLLGALHKLNQLEDGTTIKDKIIDWFAQCINFDGGFGNNIGAETHSGQGRCDRLQYLITNILSIHRCSRSRYTRQT